MKNEELIEQLNEATLELVSSDGWQTWLRARKRLHTYSLGNMLLILRQKPEAKMVAGRTRWIQDFNRYPMKGTAIWIWGPMRHSKRAQREAKAAGEQLPRVRFRPVFVFDVADTFPIEGKPEIPLAPPGEWGYTEGEVGSLMIELQAICTSLGVKLDWLDYEQTGRERGAYFPSEKRIGVCPELPDAEKAAVAIHELAHHVDLAVLPQREEDSRAIRELIAESAAFVVCDRLGLDHEAPAATYLASYAAGADDPKAALSAVAGRVLLVAKSIEEALANVRPPASAAGGSTADTAVAA